MSPQNLLLCKYLNLVNPDDNYSSANRMCRKAKQPLHKWVETEMFLSAHVVIHAGKPEYAGTHWSRKLNPEKFNKYQNFILKILVSLMGVISLYPEIIKQFFFLYLLLSFTARIFYCIGKYPNGEKVNFFMWLWLEGQMTDNIQSCFQK